MRTIGTIQGNDVIELDDGSVRFFAGATLDGDGANGQFGQPPCYAPASYHGQTLDVIGNAGHPGNWFGVVTDTGHETGTPIVQKATDPAPARMFRQLRCTCPTKMDSHCRILPRSNMWTPRQFRSSLCRR